MTVAIEVVVDSVEVVVNSVEVVVPSVDEVHAARTTSKETAQATRRNMTQAYWRFRIELVVCRMNGANET